LLTALAGDELFYLAKGGFDHAITAGSLLAGSGGGASAFTDLIDVPSSYVGQALKGVRVNAGATGLEFFTASGGGTITGPGSSTDNAIVRWDGATGTIIQNSAVLIDDSDRTFFNFGLGIGQTARVQICVDSNIENAITAGAFSNDALGPIIALGKSRSPTLGTHVIVQDQDVAGQIVFFGSNGTGFDRVANITAVVQGTPGASGDMPGRLDFRVSPDGTASPVTRLKIIPDGTISFPGGAYGVGIIHSTSASGDLVSSPIVTADISNDQVTYAKIQNVSVTARFLGRITAGAGDIEELTGAQATSLLSLFSTSTTAQGVVPGSNGLTTTFLRGDGSWAVPGGGGDVVGPASATDNAITRFDGTTGKVIQNSSVFVDDNGREFLGFGLGIGQTSRIQISVDTNVENALIAGAFSADALGPIVALGKSRNATLGSHTIVQNNDVAGQLVFFGSNGTSFDRLANITAAVDGTPGASGDMPGRLEFRVSQDGTASPVTRLKVLNDGTVVFPGGAYGTGVIHTDASGTLLASPIVTADVSDDQITYAKIQNVSVTGRFLGRITAGAGDTEELTGTQATTLLDVFTSGLKGLAPASGGGTTNFLRADGTWNVPAGGGNVSNVGTPVDNQIAVWTTATTIEGDTALTFDTTTDSLSTGVTGKFTTGTIELGAATDTTISRVSAGVIAVEGVTLLTTGTGQPLDATLTALAAFNTNGLLTQTAADTFTGRAITGTASRISVTNGSGVAGNPTIDIDAAYVGQATITTLGTITSGVWNGTDIAFANIAQGLARSVLGVTGNATADLASIQGTADQVLVVNTGGTALTFSTVATGGITNDAVDNTKLANMAQSTIKGRAVVAGTGDPTDLTGTQATAILDVFTSGLKGLVPASGGGTTTFLRADGTFAVPSGGGNVSNVGTPVDNQIAVWTSSTTIEGDTALTFDTTTDALSVGITGSFTTGTIELGAATDTTLARVSAGVASIEGVTILTTATGQPLDATLTALAAYNTNGLVTQTAADTFTGRTIIGTTNRIAVTNGSGVGGNPTIDIDAAYVGQTSITTLGTITTGTWNAAGVTATLGTGAANEPLRAVNTTNAASLQVAQFEGQRTTAAANDEAYVSYLLKNSVGTQVEFGRLTWVATDVVSTSEDARLTWSVAIAGALTAKMRLEGSALTPDANDGTALGTTTLMWSDLFLASGGVINFNNGNMTITHSAGNLNVAGGTLQVGGSNVLTAATGQPLDATLTALAAYNTNGLLTQTAADTFTGRTITGTTNRISVTNGSGVAGNPTIDIDAAYVGQATITTLGTVATGTWSASAIDATHGGTAQTTWTLGDILYSSATNALSKLAGSIVNAKRWLRQTGTGAVSAAPAWDVITAADVGSGAALTKTDDTNVTLTLGGTPATALLVAASLTLGWTGTLSLARGGTGAALTDPNLDRILFWDDSAGTMKLAALADITTEASPATGDFLLAYDGGTDQLIKINWSSLPGASGGIPTIGSSTDNAMVRWNGVGGNSVQDSVAILEDAGDFHPATNDTGALGQATLSWSDLFLASGGVINFNNGDVILSHSTGMLALGVDDAVNNGVTRVFRLTHTTTGTPAVGIGVGVEFNVETSASNFEIGAAIEASATFVTAAAENFDLVAKLMTGGAAADEKFRIKGTVGDIILSSTDPGTRGPRLYTKHNSASPAVDDFVSDWVIQGKNSAAADTVYAEILTRIVNATAGSEQGTVEFWPAIGGTQVQALRVNGNQVNPKVALCENPFTLTDGASVALDASKGNVFDLVAAGNRTISAPTNATDGQKIVIRHNASGGARTLSLTTGSAGAFRFGTDITALTATTSGLTDYIGAIYNGAASRWDVVSYVKGY